MSKEQLDILRHMLGINDPWLANPKPFRDYFCANPEDEKLEELRFMGAVEKFSERDGYWWYRTTPFGKAEAIRSHKQIRYSKSKRVYGRFLDCRESFPDLTFKIFLTDPFFERTRREA